MARFKRTALLVGLSCLIAACAADTAVMPVNSAENRINEVCIKLNPKIPMPEFTYILEEGFSRHGILTKTRREITPDCEYSLVYTAVIEKPDTKPVLDDVHIALYRGVQLIGYADRDPPKGLMQGGGIEVTRWDTTRAKIAPMLDALLAGYSVTGQSPSAVSGPPGSGPVAAAPASQNGSTSVAPPPGYGTSASLPVQKGEPTSAPISVTP